MKKRDKRYAYKRPSLVLLCFIVVVIIWKFEWVFLVVFLSLSDSIFGLRWIPWSQKELKIATTSTHNSPPSCTWDHDYSIVNQVLCVIYSFVERKNHTWNYTFIQIYCDKLQIANCYRMLYNRRHRIRTQQKGNGMNYSVPSLKWYVINVMIYMMKLESKLPFCNESINLMYLVYQYVAVATASLRILFNNLLDFTSIILFWMQQSEKFLFFLKSIKLFSSHSRLVSMVCI